jgi:D-alanine-D-alanine ligase
VSKAERPVVAVVCGGPSPEAEVSRSSGRCVAAGLASRYARVALVELDPRVREKLSEAQAQVVFPALHGPPGEDGTFQGFLETIGMPYVGSGVRASACAMDKVLARHLFEQRGLRVARALVADLRDGASAGARRAVERLGAAVVVKPASQGSALGVRFADGEAAIAEALAGAFDLEDRALVEERIAGREITVAVLERGPLEALPVIEVRTPPGSWYDYEHRYTPGLSEHIIPAPLPGGQYRRCEEMALEAHRALGCRDLSRVDFVVPPEGEPVLLEVNTLPGMTPTSLFPDAARAAGIPFEDLVSGLVERAWARAKR